MVISPSWMRAARALRVATRVAAQRRARADSEGGEQDGMEVSG